MHAGSEGERREEKRRIRREERRENARAEMRMQECKNARMKWTRSKQSVGREGSQKEDKSA